MTERPELTAMLLEFRVHDIFGDMASPQLKPKARFTMMVSPSVRLEVPLQNGKARHIFIISGKGESCAVLSYGQEGDMPSMSFAPIADKLQLLDHLVSLGCSKVLLEKANTQIGLGVPWENVEAVHEADSAIRKASGSVKRLPNGGTQPE